MSDPFAKEPAPEPDPGTDEDAWATACEEDLAAERSRRRAAAAGRDPGAADDRGLDAAEQVRRLVGDAAERFGRLVPGGALFAEQARSAIDPVLDRHAETLEHLSRAGGELAAAARAAMEPPPAEAASPSAHEPPSQEAPEPPASDPRPEAPEGGRGDRGDRRDRGEERGGQP